MRKGKKGLEKRPAVEEPAHRVWCTTEAQSPAEHHQHSVRAGAGGPPGNDKAPARINVQGLACYIELA
ncbi:MAG: hypothetical protein J5I94_25410, partial [Phaeodactylibacter sp.]|nr:hypothetical protein [Phaeodactylibacter sp.]